MLLSLTISSTVIPYCCAMSERVSPDLMVYLMGAPAGAGVIVAAARVGEGTRVTSKWTCSIGVLVGWPGPGVGAGAPTVTLHAESSAGETAIRVRSSAARGPRVRRTHEARRSWIPITVARLRR